MRKSRTFLLLSLLAALAVGIFFIYGRTPDLSLVIKQTPQGELLVVIKDPVIRGLSDGGNAYEITAATAERAALDAAETKLIGIDGRLNNATQAAGWVLAAPEGVYNQGAGTLYLTSISNNDKGDIELINDDGTQIHLFDLYIDIKNNMAHSKKPLSMRGREGRIDAASVETHYDEGRFHFTKAAISFTPPQDTKPAPLTQDATLLKGQFITDPNAPIEAQADDLYINRKTQTSDFIGDDKNPAVLKQSGLVMTAERIRLTYTDDNALEHLTAHNEIPDRKVEIKSANGRQAKAYTAHYIFAEETLILRGRVEVISEPETEQVERLYGDTLIINMATGESRLQGAPAPETTPENTDPTTTDESSPPTPQETPQETGRVRIELNN